MCLCLRLSPTTHVRVYTVAMVTEQYLVQTRVCHLVTSNKCKCCHVCMKLQQDFNCPSNSLGLDYLPPSLPPSLPPAAPHHCESACHEGECPPCDKTSEIWCRCGRESVSVPCVDAGTKGELRCQSVCKKKKNCGRHRCNVRCCVVSYD